MSAAWAEKAGRVAYDSWVRNGRPPYPDPAPPWDELSDAAKQIWRQIAGDVLTAGGAQ